jgi:hypothetical protein
MNFVSILCPSLSHEGTQDLSSCAYVLASLGNFISARRFFVSSPMSFSQPCCFPCPLLTLVFLIISCAQGSSTGHFLAARRIFRPPDLVFRGTGVRLILSRSVRFAATRFFRGFGLELQCPVFVLRSVFRPGFGSRSVLTLP